MAGMSKILSPKNALKHPINPVKATRDDWRSMTKVDMPPVPDAPAVPTVDQAQLDRQSGDYARRRRGRASTVLAGDSSVPQGSLAVRTLLGG